MKNTIVLILIGILVGGINGMFSTGAGLILIPSLIYIMHINELESRAIALLLIECLCIINICILKDVGYVNKENICIIIASICGNLIGLKYVYKVNKLALGIAFGIFSVVMGVSMVC